jgi:hypothetical protein
MIEEFEAGLRVTEQERAKYLEIHNEKLSKKLKLVLQEYDSNSEKLSNETLT